MSKQRLSEGVTGAPSDGYGRVKTWFSTKIEQWRTMYTVQPGEARKTLLGWENWQLHFHFLALLWVLYGKLKEKPSHAIITRRSKILLCSKWRNIFLFVASDVEYLLFNYVAQKIYAVESKSSKGHVMSYCTWSAGPHVWFCSWRCSVYMKLFAPVRFFIPSQAPVSRNGLTHTCQHAYFCFQRRLETLLPGKGASCYLDMEGKPQFKPPAPLLWPPSPPPPIW